MVMKPTNVYKRLILYYIVNMERLLHVSANLVTILWACANLFCYSLIKNGRNVLETYYICNIT